MTRTTSVAALLLLLSTPSMAQSQDGRCEEPVAADPAADFMSNIGDIWRRFVGGGTRPTEALPPFSVQRFWDADSTPPALAALSRAVGGEHPAIGARTPEIEAGIVMASLMHDVSYYYGGGIKEKHAADALFGAQIPFFVGKLDPASVEAAKVAAAFDVAAVTAGGGFPFRESYSWSYGLAKGDRGFTTLAEGEREKIEQVARATFQRVVEQIANGTFEMSDVLKAKLARATPEYREQIKRDVVALARSLQKDFANGDAGSIPGFAD